MGIFSRAARPPAEQFAAGNTWPFNGPLSTAATGRWLEGWPTGTGSSALAIPTVYRCVQTIGTKVAKFPMTATSATGREKRVPLLERPDPSTNRYRFLVDTAYSMLMRGNAYWRVTRAEGRPIALEVVPADLVTVAWLDDRRRHRKFTVTGGGELSERELVQVPLMLWPGALRGVGPIEACRIVWEGQIAADKMAASNFTDAVMPSGVFSSPTGLTDTNAQKLLDKVLARHAGSREPLVLSGGVEFKPLAVTARDAQWIEHRSWTSGDIARAFGVPAGLLSLPSAGGINLTYTNIRDARTELLHMALDPLMCEIGSAFEQLVPGIEVGWDVTSYLPPLEATDPTPATEPAQRQDNDR